MYRPKKSSHFNQYQFISMTLCRFRLSKKAIVTGLDEIRRPTFTLVLCY